ncbi:MAG: major royal jelly family protein [bacterium]|nr:major royal jelly family protein [bacterium]
MKRICLFALLALGAVAFTYCGPPPGTIEVYAELKENPGNVTVSSDDRVFASVHQFRPGSARLVEITPDGRMTAYPDAGWNADPERRENVFRSVLGVQVDTQDRLWVLDNGLGVRPIAPRLFAFDIKTGRLDIRYEFPAKSGAPGSFLNDLAVDAKRGFVYIADIGGAGQPGIVVVNFSNPDEITSHRFDGAEGFQPEDVDVVVDGKVVSMGGQPARIGINPITISRDGETVFFGPMSGTSYYSVPAEQLRSPGETSALKIERVGPKPVSDGASTDRAGRHYFTNLANNSIDVLKDGELKTLVKDDRLLNWPDALSFGGDGWLYVATNRLHLSPALNGGTEGAGDGGFYIVRIAAGAKGVAGR